MLKKILLTVLIVTFSIGAVTFPKLTGRVVDTAHILSSKTKHKVVNLIKDMENNSSNQLVVVTLKSLQGYSISDYGYRLGRHWGIGQKGKNNGVLLIIAPKERKVRIEVGYGLEGKLTDALSSLIIQKDILPYFKKGNYDKGIEEGVKSIIAAINGSYKRVAGDKKKNLNKYIPLIIFLFFFIFIIVNSFLRKSSRDNSTYYFGNGSNFGDDFNSFDSGFSGGGGSFGGGGADGGW